VERYHTGDTGRQYVVLDCLYASITSSCHICVVKIGILDILTIYFTYFTLRVHLMPASDSRLLVTGARTWNDLPVDVTSAPSLLTFRKRLKLHLFRLSYPGLVL